jgi:hypothetical protein
MVRSARSRFAWQAGVAILPAAILLCCAGRADAECGDYVRIIGNDGTVQPMPGHESKPADQPCHGPFCHGGPKAPNPPPPAPTSPVPDPNGLVTETGGPDNAAATRFDLEPDGSPVRQTQSIFDPPRAS